VKFGLTGAAKAVGAIAAHTTRADGVVIKKGETVTAEIADALAVAGVNELTVARLEDGDVGEDEAARALASVLAGANVRVEKPFTGRSNLFSLADGVLRIDAPAIDAINDVDEAITVATLPRWRRVVAGEMIGTVKIIPFAAPAAALERAIAVAGAGALTVAPFRPLRVGVISTLLPGLKAATVAKTLRALEKRLEPAGARIVAEERTAHATGELEASMRRVAPQCDILIVFGASAITDRRDVIPAALTAAGGEIGHFGMPVDPGNLLLIGRLGDGGRLTHVLGAPGCARSPKENGFDWVLHRLLAGVEVTAADIRGMGVGGLLMEIVQRGQLRSGAVGGDDA